jgi:thiol-disulfide isomerase/thioredoxin
MSVSNISALNLLAILCIVACALLSLACTKERGSSADKTPVLSSPPQTTFPMPPITAETGSELGWTLLDGARARLADYRGKVLVLDFYATWCEPCRKSIPNLIELQQRVSTQSLQVVGLNVGGPDDRVKVMGFASEFHISYPLGFPDKPLSDFFLSDNDTIPQTFVFDRKGQLVKRIIGYDSETQGQLEQAIESALVSGSQ